ncbi:MAG TPA: class I SAM-dependent methyltransferase [Polyangia bacterium]|nr:class I SAM-dependent methyltransferase [Polyangia bacterium]
MSGGYDTDKHGYLPRYEELFAPLRGAEVRLLELGVLRGGSLALWRDWFPRGLIVGLDENPVALDDPSGRIRVYQGPQQQRRLLRQIIAECAPDGFDIIIDDCSHVAEYARESFDLLFRKGLKPGGLYAIEDWGTGYMPEWFDGAPLAPPPRPPGGHTAGMVGLVKELIDHLYDGRPEDLLPDPRYAIHDMTISPGLTILRKHRLAPPIQPDAKSRTTP